MTSFTVGSISVEVESKPVTITDTPVQGAEEQEGIARNPAVFTSLDGWLGRFGVFEYENLDKLMGKFYWHKQPVDPPYSRLVRAGAVSVVNEGGRWIAPLRAMKKVGKDYPTLNRVSDEDLDYLAGQDFREFVAGFGDVEIKRYGDLVQNAGKQVANGLGIAVPAGQVGPLIAMIAVTRPLALVKRFGEAP